MTDEAGHTFAQLLDHLFREVHPPARGPYTYTEVAEGIQEASGGEGKGLTASAIQQLRTGAKKNPTRHTIKALAGFFGVPAGYFFDEETAERARAEIAVLAAMRDQGVRTVALRANGLSTESLQMLSAVIEQARRLEGLPGDTPTNNLKFDD
ncbi:helix-turn-helix domain-containing protein [Streptomyces sp. H27-C3]|uniref:helix-turn-helix domain-containing protein n=1 Tax=Streptomyces sp. H27-C3 TaxID=3046305 RepID=UPI0024BB61EC|nr:helix-turn-helix domain-containing protein [Streptomyces sp. H27-C3]MDJ0460194.1 helix-turn-helix domain-containing protein [Streptomyces sp. H27-C3]